MKVNKTFSIDLEILQDPLFESLCEGNASGFIQELIVDRLNKERSITQWWGATMKATISMKGKGTVKEIRAKGLIETMTEANYEIQWRTKIHAAIKKKTY